MRVPLPAARMTAFMVEPPRRQERQGLGKNDSFNAFFEHGDIEIDEQGQLQLGISDTK